MWLLIAIIAVIVVLIAYWWCEHSNGAKDGMYGGNLIYVKPGFDLPKSEFFGNSPATMVHPGSVHRRRHRPE